MVWKSSTNKAGLLYTDTGTVHRCVELLTLRYMPVTQKLDRGKYGPRSNFGNAKTGPPLPK